MQASFDFGAAADIVFMRDRTAAAFGPQALLRRRDPLRQLVRSMLGSRTRDEISDAAFARLIDRYESWPELAAAQPDAIREVIADVTYAGDKAERLNRSIRLIAAERPDFDLDFLGALPVEEALRWLERLPGVARKVAAATLNFSTLNRPAFVVDEHVRRVLCRFGLIGLKADNRRAYYAVMAAAESWDAPALAELHILLKRLGQTFCRKGKKECHSCPLRERCGARLELDRTVEGLADSQSRLRSTL
jgi:endonuclease-3